MTTLTIIPTTEAPDWAIRCSRNLPVIFFAQVSPDVILPIVQVTPDAGCQTPHPSRVNGDSRYGYELVVPTPVGFVCDATTCNGWEWSARYQEYIHTGACSPA